MSEPKQQPKILLHKPKKSQRTPSGVNSASHDGVGARGVSTTSKTPPPPPPPVPKEPFWYRFRTALTTLLVLNAVLVGYTLFRTNFKSVEPNNEAESEKKEKEGETEKGSDKPNSVDTKSKTSEVTETEKGSDKPKSVDTKSLTSEVTENKVSDALKSAVPESPKATLATQPIVQAINKPKPTDEEQQELYKWMLAEKRKINPTTKAEKAQNDAEKALLKEYLRGNNALNL